MNSMLTVCASVALLLAAIPVHAGGDMPQKAFSVEDGIVAVRAGVTPNSSAPAALPIGKLKHPTRYFVELVNESPYPIWLDATWAFPDGRDGKQTTSKAVKSSKLPPGGSYWFYVDKLGVLVDKKIIVDIAAWADEKRSKRIGEQTAELAFAQPDVDVFLANFPSAFKNQPKDSPAVVISGWRDLPKARAEVPGTSTDAVLMRDVQHALWKTDSLQRFTCERSITDATPISVDDSVMFSRMPEDAIVRARVEQGADTIAIERWRARSCGQDVVYEVLLSASKKGGTDVMVVEIVEPPQPPAAVDMAESD